MTQSRLSDLMVLAVHAERMQSTDIQTVVDALWNRFRVVSYLAPIVDSFLGELQGIAFRLMLSSCVSVCVCALCVCVCAEFVDLRKTF